MMDYDITKGRTYMYFEKEPLYPFGYGLSYTDFEYSKVVISDDEISKGDTLKVSFSLKNTGKFDGEEVVQFYVSPHKRLSGEPIKQLKAFKRVFVRKGETIRLELDIPYSELQIWDETQDRFVLPNIKRKIGIGASSDDIRLNAVFRTV